MNSGEYLGHDLKRALAAPLPGLAAQLAMAPRYGPDRTFTPAVEASCLKAGVMLLLYLRQDEPYIVLTRRTSTVLRHKDQIGFPGGNSRGARMPSGRLSARRARRSGSIGTASMSSDP